jgi:hypothetical protein
MMLSWYSTPMEQEFGYLLWGRKADIINQVKVSNSQNVYVVGRHSVTITFLQLIVLKPILTQLFRTEGKTGRFFVKFNANGERIWGYYGVALVTYLLILQKIYISGIC